MQTQTSAAPTKSLTVEDLVAIADQIKAVPHLRIVVSKFVGPMQVLPVPTYYHPRLCRDVNTWIIGAEAWKRLVAETDIEAPKEFRVGFGYGAEVEFSPLGWRP